MRAMIKLLCIGASSFALSILPSWSAQWVVQYRTVDYPGAAWTEVNGISSPPATFPLGPSYIVGTYADITGTHGFALSRGIYTPIDVPGGHNTQAFGVNSQGQIVGTYQSGMPSSPTTSSFIRTAGTFTLFSQCGVGPGVEGHWEAHGINNVGNIVGTGKAIGLVEAFLYRGPNWPCFGFPYGAQSEFYGINNTSPLVGVGYFKDKNGRTHGLIYGVNHAVGQFDIPGASDTWLRGQNDNGFTVGFYLLKGAHGFVNDKQNITTINYPLATTTEVHAINNGNPRGFSIGGSYFDKNGKRHGFLASLSLPLVNRTAAGTPRAGGCGDGLCSVGAFGTGGAQSGGQAQGFHFLGPGQLPTETLFNSGTLFSGHLVGSGPFNFTLSGATIPNGVNQGMNVGHATGDAGNCSGFGCP